LTGFDIIKIDHHSDERGWNVHPVDYNLLDDCDIKNIHIVSMEPGARRGNHLHRRQTEHIFIMGGPCLVAAQNLETGEKLSITVQANDLYLFRAAIGIAHVFKNISEHTIHALCYSDLRFDPMDMDIEPFNVL